MKTVTWLEGVKAIHRAARIVNDTVEKFDLAKENSGPLVLAIVAHMGPYDLLSSTN